MQQQWLPHELEEIWFLSSEAQRLLLGLFSLVCLIAHHLTTTMKLVPASTAWYRKTEATFSHVLALVQRAIWAEKYFDKSVIQGEQVIIRRDDWEVLIDQLASTA